VSALELPRDRALRWKGATVVVRRLRARVLAAELSRGERALVQAARSPKRRQELRVGRATLHAALRAAGEKRSTEVLSSKQGRPQLVGLTGWCVSLCHGGELVAAAVARGPVGIDVEPLSRLPQVTRVVEGWTHPPRGAPVPELPVPLAFLQWTAWEALGKLTGKGVLAGAKSFIRPELTADGLVARSRGRRLRWWTLADHILCVAVGR
jgi:phosphopantetheinyl transferase